MSSNSRGCPSGLSSHSLGLKLIRHRHCLKTYEDTVEGRKYPSEAVEGSRAGCTGSGETWQQITNA
ncbi:hypothetical protein BaRGS_00035238, partial [Batillaria attramentaria]